jgi:hypothetical protein
VRSLTAGPLDTCRTSPSSLTEEAVARDRDAALAVAARRARPGARRVMAAARSGLRLGSGLGKAVFETVAYGERVDMAGELDDDSLRRLLDWLYE